MNKNMNEMNNKINFVGKTSLFFIKRFQIVLLIILLIVATGISGILFLPKESLPEIVFPTIFVQTSYPGASPEDVERLVSEEIENKLNSLDDLEEIKSESNFGYSNVILSFTEDVDIDRKKLEIDNKISDISFSDGVNKPEVSIFNTSEIPLMEISVSGRYTIFELTQISENLKKEIESVSGVDEVELLGGINRQIQILINPAQLMSLGINEEDIKNSLAGSNISLPVGESNLNGIQYNIRIDESFQTIQSIKNASIILSENRIIKIQDIADVIDSSEKITEYSETFNRGLSNEIYPTIVLNVYREARSDVVETASSVLTQIENQKGVTIPDDIQIKITNDLSVNVKNDLNKIQNSALSGLFVVIIVLFLFIGFKESLIVSITIPLSLMMTLGVLSYFGITLNTFAILGLIVSLGLLVDNSIIAMENINRLKKTGMDYHDAALYGINQVGFPILAATLTTIAAFYPLAILPGILGEFVNTIPRTIIIALIASLIVSITITPAIYINLSKKRIEHLFNLDNSIIRTFGIILIGLISFFLFYDNWNHWLIGIISALLIMFLLIIKTKNKGKSLEDSKLILKYQMILQWILEKTKRKVAVLLFGVIILILSTGLILGDLVKISFFPQNEPTSLDIIIDTPGGTSLYDTAAVVEKIEKYLKENENISSFNATIGGLEKDYAYISAILSNENNADLSGFDILEDIQSDLIKFPGAQIIVQAVSSSGPPVGKPIGLELIGDDLDILQNVSKDYQMMLEKIPGVYNIETSSKDGVPQVLIDINEYKAQSLGLSTFEIANQIKQRVEGIKATTLKDNGDEIDVMISYGNLELNEISSLESIYIETYSKEIIPLMAIAEIKEISGLSSISRKDGDRIIYIDADLKQNFNINDFKTQFESIISNYNQPDAIRLIYGGDVQGIQENFINLFRSMIIAVFLVFIILTLQFNSIKQPFVILTTVPMALVGVLIGLAVTQNDFGFYAFMGMVALVGIAVNDAIVLIDYMNYLRKEGLQLHEAIIEAGKTRFNPVLATTMTTIGGVLPLALKEVYYAQFGYTLIFGLIFTTVLTLIYIPIMYSILEGKKGGKNYV
ncbi:MAG: efflux RND transporter permease subunit [Clostridiales bacterium]|nr:efflux RND transporter permease subunit [Clostridiales bacterium]